MKLLRISALLFFLSNSLFASYLKFLPKGKSGELVHHNYYTLKYAEEHEQAHWVMYDIDASKLKYVVERTNDFREDPYVSTYSASADDYMYSGYDRGHMIPAGSMRFSWLAMSESFFMSNMSPQHPSLNRYQWQDLEKQVRRWARSDKLYVVTGPVLSGKLKKLPSGVSVPEQFFKVIYSKSGFMIAFLFPNTKVYGDIDDYVVSVDQVERATGLDFFSQLPYKLEQALEAANNKQNWFH